MIHAQGSQVSGQLLGTGTARLMLGHPSSWGDTARRKGEHYGQCSWDNHNPGHCPTFTLSLGFETQPLFVLLKAQGNVMNQKVRETFQLEKHCVIFSALWL